MTTIVVLAKEPLPGRVKTRLCSRFSPSEAAQLACAALQDTLDAVLRTPARRRILMLDGRPGDWAPAGFEVLSQCSGDLDRRIADAFARTTGPTLLIGMDTPQVTPCQLTVDWENHDAWFGPSDDGGFWALGMREPDPALVLGVPMSTGFTGRVQLARLHEAGLDVGLLPVLRDVDTPACAAHVAGVAPATRFAQAYEELTGRVCDVG